MFFFVTGKTICQSDSSGSLSYVITTRGYLVFIEGQIDEVMVFPDSLVPEKLFERLENSVGIKIPNSDNWDMYRLKKIASSYKILIELQPANDTIIKKSRLFIIKAEIKYRPWNTGIPKSESYWKIWYRKAEYLLRYKIDLDGAIIEAKPLERKKILKFNRFKGSPPPKRII